MTCEYCDEWHNLPIRYASGILCELDAHIENDEVFLTLCGEEAVMRINFCPWCGRDLREGVRDERSCECIAEYAKSPIDGKTIVLHRCSSCHELMRPHMNYCPNCGAKRREDNA